MFRINKDLTIGELLEQAAAVHGIDIDDLIEDLKGFMESM